MGKHSRSRSRSHSHSRSYSRHHHRHQRRSLSPHKDTKEYLSRDQWNELKKKSLFGYSNDNNPFGDENLDKPFVWKKKEGEENSGMTKKELVLKRLQKGEEIKKAQTRRQETMEERIERQRKMEEEEKEKDKKEALVSIQKEKEFHLAQRLVGIRVRIQSGREKAIDRLLKNIMLTDAINRPLNGFDNSVLRKDIKGEEESIEAILACLSPAECGEVLAELEEIMLLPEMEPYLTYLSAVRAVVLEHANQQEEEGGVHESVVNDVKALIEGKNFEAISALQREIEEQLESGEGMDVDYWTAILKMLRMEYFHGVIQREQDAFLRQRQDQVLRNSGPNAQSMAPSYRVYKEEDAVEREFSPPPLSRSAIGTGKLILIRAEETDGSELKREREMVRHRELENLACSIMKNRVSQKHNEKIGYTAYESSFTYVPEKGTLEEDEEELKKDIQLPHQIYAWQAKYVPKKPQFFNKIKRGYEWNQYNQVHYDLNNPPPKVIQGYRFNVFYPDLVDKSRQPSFTVHADTQDPEYCILTFHAGAPYEDIAFRVVNRAWDRGRKSGYKCVFERGVLHLYFDFKKYRYKVIS